MLNLSNSNPTNYPTNASKLISDIHYQTPSKLQLNSNKHSPSKNNEIIGLTPTFDHQFQIQQQHQPQQQQQIPSSPLISQSNLQQHQTQQQQISQIISQSNLHQRPQQQQIPSQIISQSNLQQPQQLQYIYPSPTTPKLIYKPPLDSNFDKLRSPSTIENDGTEEGNANSIKETSSSTKETSSSIKDTSSSIKETSSSIKETSSCIEKDQKPTKKRIIDQNNGVATKRVVRTKIGCWVFNICFSIFANFFVSILRNSQI